MADGIVFFPSFYESIEGLPDPERLQAYEAIIRYGLFGEIIEMTPIVKSLFVLVKPVIDSSQRRYRAARENGKKGGRPPKNQTENQTENQTGNQTGNHDKDKDKDTDKEKDTDKDIPTLETVILYAKQRNSPVNPQTFFDYYAAAGWKDSKGRLINWKQKLISWEMNKREEPLLSNIRDPSRYLDGLEDSL